MILYINSIESVRLDNLFLIDTISSLDELKEAYIDSKSLLSIDARQLSSNNYTSLLKFVEEYRGDINLVLNEPVPTPILSRSLEIYKTPKYNELQKDVRYVKAFKSNYGLTNNTKTKILDTLGIKIEVDLSSLDNVESDSDNLEDFISDLIDL